MFYTVRPPFLLKRFFASLTWQIPGSEKNLYLTFDDGPHPTATPFILDQLNRVGAKASFFCLGKNVAAYPDLLERILDEKHTVGNHTYNHLNGWKTSDKIYYEDIAKAARLIDSDLFRPPYGKITPFQIKLLQNKKAYVPSSIIMWSLLSGDFDEKLSPQKCYQNILLNAKSGDIIVFHDSQKAWERLQFALPRVLDHFSAGGFSFKPL